MNVWMDETYMDDFCNSLTSPVAASGVCVVEPINGWMYGWMKQEDEESWMDVLLLNRQSRGAARLTQLVLQIDMCSKIIIPKANQEGTWEPTWKCALYFWLTYICHNLWPLVGF
jgi:hypothetical protein